MKRTPWSPRRLGIVVLGIVMLAIAAGFLARTEWVIGPRVAAEIERVARQRGLDIEVQSLRPHGFFGLRLQEVAVRIPRGTFAVEGYFEAVDISPSVAALLHGDVEIEEVEVHGGHAAIVPGVRRAPKEALPKEASRRDAPPRSTAEAAAVPSRTTFILHDVDLDVSTAVRSRRPFHLTRAEFSWRPGASPEDVSGYGVLPDEQPFALISELRGEAYHVAVVPERPTQMDRWLAGMTPISLSVRSIDICVSCAQRTITLDSPEFRVPVWRDDVFVRAPSASAEYADGALNLKSPELEIATTGDLEFNGRVTRSNVTFHPVSGELVARLRIADPEGGTLDLDSSWDGRKMDVSFYAKDFHLSSIWKLVDVLDPVDPGVVNGSVDCSFDLRRRLVSLQTAVGLRELTFDWPFVAHVPLEFPRLHVRFDGLVDIGGRTVSLARGRLRIGGANPMHFRARVIDAGQGWAFRGSIGAERLNVLTVQDALPVAMADVVTGAILDGWFAFGLDVSGHSAFPKSLHLEGELDGELDVLRDSPSADVKSLKTRGPPPVVDDPSIRRTWLDYSEISSTVRNVLLAAEDATFFEHTGFDWGGFRRAMVHNLEKKELQRGGSTISQQVVKNLFLRPDRTLTRKLQEAYLTWRMESEISKERILEIYLNIANWGPGVHGIAQAARHYFEASPDALTIAEMALLAAILPNPEIFGGAVKEGRLPASRVEKMEHIFSNLRFLGHITPAQYRAFYGATKRGEVGRLSLEASTP